MDLVEMLEQGRWKDTLDLIEQLPLTSRFRFAQMRNPEHAEKIAESILRQREEDQNDDDTSSSDFGSIERRLTKLIELSKAQIQWLQKVAGVKSPSKMKPEPQPKTLVSELLQRKEQEVGLAVAEQFGFDRSDFFMDAA